MLTEARRIIRKYLLEDLRCEYTHGHPRFVEITLEELELHDTKNQDYTGSGAALGNFERVAKIRALYPNLPRGDPAVVAIDYMLKQLDCVLWALNDPHALKVEGLSGRLQDISVYAKIVRLILEDREADAINKGGDAPCSAGVGEDETVKYNS